MQLSDDDMRHIWINDMHIYFCTCFWNAYAKSCMIDNILPTASQRFLDSTVLLTFVEQVDMLEMDVSMNFWQLDF